MSAKQFRGFPWYGLDLYTDFLSLLGRFDLFVVDLDTRHTANLNELQQKIWQNAN